ncbi:nuclear transport factor 2 family protein [Ascidiimonas aurantiaca]|uniref:nuclear transport factor 2 family protein n=1 Tax=Ascidiimonas aurantiaca TaxID=1685432 RepID=UPI0030EB4389
MKSLCFFFIFTATMTGVMAQSNAEELKAVNHVINTWHEAASVADFDAYFDKMTNDAVFIGTDPTENWSYHDFKTFSRPYFERGKAWSFQAVDRNVFFDQNYTLAWFDELLDTRMQLCRGSGVLKKINGTWKIAHYVLSITIPNENVDDVVALKKVFDIRVKDSLRQ